MYLRLALSSTGSGGVPRTLICTRRRNDVLTKRLADCKPFDDNEDDLKVKKWLENHGIKVVPFVNPPFKLHVSQLQMGLHA